MIKNIVLKKKTLGFSLIEVLLAVAIMSFGLLALASLQVSLMRSSSSSKAQSVALSLAKDKLEDLRAFRDIDAYRALDSSSDTPDSDPVTAGVQDFGGVTYTRSWVISRYAYLSAGGTQFVPVTPNTGALSSSYASNNEFKKITVTVTWTDASGTTATPVIVQDIISALSPEDSAALSKQTSTTRPRGPIVKIFNPGATAGVIPIAVGNGSNSAATNPKPELVVGSSVVETRFDVLTYAGLNGNTADAQSRVETSVVGCTCDFDAKPANQNPLTNLARSKRPTYWNGYRYVVPIDATYVPPAGVSNATQSDRCTTCCRDHHDSDSSVIAGVPKFSPYKSSHDHYNAFAVGSPAVTTGEYKEACRLIRVDGFFRVAPDMNNDYFGLLATENLSGANYYATTPIPDSTAQTNYQGFVIDYLKERYIAGTGESYPNTTGTRYNNPSAVGKSAIETTHSINSPALVDTKVLFNGVPLAAKTINNASKSNPIVLGTSSAHGFVVGDSVYISGVGGMTQLNGRYFTVSAVTLTTFTLLGVNSTAYSDYTSGGTVVGKRAKWLHSRGLFADFLEKEATVVVNDAKTNCVLQTEQGKADCTLKYLPFTSINLTEIADWESAADTVVTVTNLDFSQSISSVDPVRGKVASGNDSSSTNVTSLSRPSNSGLLDLSFNAISPDDNVKLTDSQAFRANNMVVVVPSVFEGSFFVNLTKPASPVFTPGISFITGSQLSAACNVAVPYKCPVNNATNSPPTGLGPADLVYGDPAGTMGVVISGYNQTFTTNVTSGSVPGCTKTGDPTITWTLGGGDSYTKITCINYTVTGPLAWGVGTVTPSDGAQSESTTFSGLTINKGETFAVTIGSRVDTVQPLTCTYTCSKANCTDNGNKNIFTVTSPGCP